MVLDYQWHYTKDHSKWAVADKPGGESGGGSWVRVADINRQTSQEKRGGGGICFEDEGLRECLRGIYRCGGGK